MIGAKAIQNITLCIMLVTSLHSSGQERRLVAYDVIHKTLDTLKLPDFDLTLSHEKTSHNIGSYNDMQEHLVLLPPTENVVEGTQFSLKKPASEDYDINNFPLRTSVKLFHWENDSLKGNCSGSMISKKHILTAFHCIVDREEDLPAYDSLLVCPVFDNGEIYDIFGCSRVKRILYFEDWSLTDTDISVLELEEPLGDNTGWISIGFDADDTSLMEGIFYKFSYPLFSLPSLDPREYNGDTLYYSYGAADNVSDYYFGVNKAWGIPGESGSSLIKIEGGTSYTSYGVLTWANNLLHSRLTNWKYFAIKSVIESELVSNLPILQGQLHLSIFPNPTSGNLKLTCNESFELQKIVVYDIAGNVVLEVSDISNEMTLDLSPFAQGTYYLVAIARNELIVKPIIKIAP